MEQGNCFDSTPVPSCQEGIATTSAESALDAAVTRLLTADLQPDADSERHLAPADLGAAAEKPLTASAPLDKLIASHRAARATLCAATGPMDVVAVQEAGGDISETVMAAAEATWAIASEAEVEAFEALLAHRPADVTDLAEMLAYIAASPALGEMDTSYSALQHIAAAAEHAAAMCDPFADVCRHPGFVPMPAYRPQCFMAIGRAIPIEAKRLLDVAQSEFDRRAPAYADFPTAERYQHLARMRTEYRLDALAALVENDVDTTCLALAPVVLPMLDRFDKLWADVDLAYAAACIDAEAAGIDIGDPGSELLPSWLAYLGLYQPASDLSNDIKTLVRSFMDTPTVTLEGLILKARVAATLEHYAEDVARDVNILMRKRFGGSQPLTEAPQPEVVLAPAPSETPRGYVPCPDDAHQDAYGLRIDAGGAGAHMPPGSTVIVEPIPTAPRNFAVAYFKNQPSPSIWHVGDSFSPDLLNFHPDSTVFPLIELFDPVTGRRGYKDCRSFEKLHRVQGIYTPVEILEEFGAPPEALPIIGLNAVAEGCLKHEIRCASNYPVLREGDVALVDTTRTDLVHGSLCLIRWSNNSVSILQTNFRKMGSGDPVWCVDPINRPRRPGMLERLQARGGPLYSSDGPYTYDLLHPKIVGTVVGICGMERRVGLAGRGAA